MEAPVDEPWKRVSMSLWSDFSLRCSRPPGKRAQIVRCPSLSIACFTTLGRGCSTDYVQTRFTYIGERYEIYLVTHDRFSLISNKTKKIDDDDDHEKGLRSAGEVSNVKDDECDHFDLRTATVGLRARDADDPAVTQSGEAGDTGSGGGGSFVLTVTERKGVGPTRAWELSMDTADELLTWVDWLDLRDAMGQGNKSSCECFFFEL